MCKTLRTLRKLCDFAVKYSMYQPRNYPSKILLTGEYTVLLGHPAIAIPWNGRYAEWNATGGQREYAPDG